MNFLACNLTPDHVGRTVAFYADGHRVCGRLDDYCRNLRTYAIRVDGHLYRNVPASSEIDLIAIEAERQRDDAHAAYEKAGRERDAAVERAEQAETDAEKWNLHCLDGIVEATYRPAVTRADVAEALARCLNPEMWNVTFPAVVNEICDLFGIEAEQAVDPVELLAGQIEDATRQAVREVIDALGKSVDTQAVEDSILATVGDDAQWLARHVLGQEADHA